MKILFVENHPEFARTVAAAFLGEHDLTIVPSIKAAMAALEQTEFEVLLVDYDLDDGKGAELVGSIRGTGNSVRIIAISAKDEGNAKLTKAGANAVCQKSEFNRIGLLL